MVLARRAVSVNTEKQHKSELRKSINTLLFHKYDLLLHIYIVIAVSSFSVGPNKPQHAGSDLIGVFDRRSAA